MTKLITISVLLLILVGCYPNDVQVQKLTERCVAMGTTVILLHDNQGHVRAAYCDMTDVR
jgi:hypothetical protein